MSESKLNQDPHGKGCDTMSGSACNQYSQGKGGKITSEKESSEDKDTNCKGGNRMSLSECKNKRHTKVEIQ